LKQTDPRAAQYYDITVEAGGAGCNAIAIRWQRITPVDDTLPGVYCLRSNRTDWDATTLWHTYTRLTDLEAGFREIKQEIGSAARQTRNPDALFNHLHFCMVATTITWLYAAHLNHVPSRRYASQHTTEYAFADVRRALAKQLANEGFGIDCQDIGKPDRNPLIAAVMRLVA
jgi:hypothetical protein